MIFLGDRETKLALLKLHIREYYKEPGAIPPAKKRIARRRWNVMVHQRWAADEMVLYLTQSTSNDLIFAAEQFAKAMDKFACIEHDGRRMFSIAYDVATELVDYLYSL